MQTDALAMRAATGAAAGLVATAVLQPLRAATKARFPETSPPMRQEPGEFMVEQAERALPRTVREKVPEPAERIGAKTLALGYGMTFGVLYRLVRKTPGNVFVDAAALGVASWAVGYLGWLPATGLMPPVTRQEPAKVVVPLLQHMVFGLVAVAVVRGIVAATRQRESVPSVI